MHVAFKPPVGPNRFLRLPIRNNFNFSDRIVHTFFQMALSTDSPLHLLPDVLESLRQCDMLNVRKLKIENILKSKRGEVLSPDYVDFSTGNFTLNFFFHPLPSRRIFLRLFWNLTHIRGRFQCANLVTLKH